MQDFAASVREHVKNTGTKPVQPDPMFAGSFRHHERKNPGSAATETGINSDTKASSLLPNDNLEVATKANDNQFSGPMMETAA